MPVISEDEKDIAMLVVGKQVHYFANSDIYFTDNTVLRIFCERDSGCQQYSLQTLGYLQLQEAQDALQTSIIEHGWKLHRASEDSKGKELVGRIPQGWGGFFMMPDSEPWPDMHRQVEWLNERYKSLGRGYIKMDWKTE